MFFVGNTCLMPIAVYTGCACGGWLFAVSLPHVRALTSLLYADACVSTPDLTAESDGSQRRCQGCGCPVRFARRNAMHCFLALCHSLAIAVGMDFTLLCWVHCCVLHLLSGATVSAWKIPLSMHMLCLRRKRTPRALCNGLSPSKHRCSDSPFVPKERERERERKERVRIWPNA